MRLQGAGSDSGFANTRAKRKGCAKQIQVAGEFQIGAFRRWYVGESSCGCRRFWLGRQDFEFVRCFVELETCAMVERND